MYLRSPRPSLHLHATQWHMNAMCMWSCDHVRCMGGGRGMRMGAGMHKKWLERVSRGAGHTVVAKMCQWGARSSGWGPWRIRGAAEGQRAWVGTWGWGHVGRGQDTREGVGTWANAGGWWDGWVAGWVGGT